jgi:hypothetical protein
LDQKESQSNSALHIKNASPVLNTHSTLDTHGVNSSLNAVALKPDYEIGVVSNLHNHGAISALHIYDEAVKIKKRS